MGTEKEISKKIMMTIVGFLKLEEDTKTNLLQKIENLVDPEYIMEKVGVDATSGEVFAIGNTRGEGAPVREMIVCSLCQNNKIMYCEVEDGNNTYLSECADQNTARVMWKHHCKRVGI